MLELTQITRQKDSKVFAEIVNRLREGNHTVEDINKIKERLIKKKSINDPKDVQHLLIQNVKVTQFNKIAYQAASGEKYSIQAIDSVIGATSTQLRDKIL